MSEPPPSNDFGRKRSVEETIQFIKEDFESAWEQVKHGSPPPSIDAYLVDTSELAQSEIRQALEQVDRQYQGLFSLNDLTQDADAETGDQAAPREQTRPELEPTIDGAPQMPQETAPTEDFTPGEATDRNRAGRAGKRRLPSLPGYEILGELGRGGMGVVYRARQEGLKRLVAVKMILGGSHAGASELARFQTEAEAVAQLQHPNIVQIHEVSEHAGMPFFSLEFVDGVSLDEELAGKPMEVAHAAQLMETLARAMHYAHQHGIIHRDLKPANVLLTSDGVPKISDFGLAKRLEGDSSQTKSGSVMGTPSYMAPEQATGTVERIGPLSDVYTLGAVLYVLLTGRPPFMGANPVDTLMQVIDREPVPPSQLQLKVPLDLETICLKCLQKDTRKRYASAEELADDLKRFSAREPILARPVSTWERVWRWCRRNPRMAALSGLAASLALTVVIGSPIAVVQINQERLVAVEAQGAAEISARHALEAQQVAQEAEKVADQRAEVATAQAALALGAHSTLIGEVQGRLAGRPEVQDLTEALLTFAVEGLKDVARDADNANLIDKEMAKAQQKMGRLFEDLGRTSLALERHKKAHEIIEALAAENPHDPIATKRNPAATRNKLGDACLRLGRPIQARQYYQTALDLRKEWVESDPDQLWALLAVANSYGLLGMVDLMLGDPMAARENYLQSLKWREQMPDAVNRRVESQREWAGVYDRLGDTSLKLGDGDDAEKQYKRALEIRQLLAKTRSKSVWHKQDMVISYVNLGDLRLRGYDDPAGADELYHQALELTEELRSSDPRSAFPQRALSMLNYRLGTTSLMQEKTDEANQYYRKCLQQRETLAAESPEDISAQIDLMLALARCGEHERAASMAGAFGETLPPSSWLFYQIGCGYSLCAAAEESSAEEDRTDMAIASLRQAISYGWKDFPSLRSDPDLEPIRSHSGYTDLLREAEGTASDGHEQ